MRPSHRPASTLLAVKRAYPGRSKRLWLWALSARKKSADASSSFWRRTIPMWISFKRAISWTGFVALLACQEKYKRPRHTSPSVRLISTLFQVSTEDQYHKTFKQFLMGHSRPLFLIFVFSIQLTEGKQLNARCKSLTITGFELGTSGVRSDCSTNWATTTAFLHM